MENMENQEMYTMPNEDQGQKGKKNVVTLITVIGAVLAVVACFLPYYTVSIFGMEESITYVAGDGKLVVVAEVVVVILALVKLNKASLIPAIIGLGVTLYDVSSLQAMLNKELGAFGDLGDLGSCGAGYYMVIVGAIVACIGGILAFVWKLSRK